ncbi:unannotated protein [freshwater metagenome]|uniref:Unannotated protein n=1 Tax=freshwater metagenome TaxID=449393 RepID=A0A6J6BGK0_9ZZZZ
MGRAGCVQNRAVTVENKVVLSAHRVDVDNCRTELDGSGCQQGKTCLVLPRVKRRGIDDDDSVKITSRELGDGAIRAPQIFTNQKSRQHTTHFQHESSVTGDEHAFFVKNGIVRKMTLGIRCHNPSLVQNRERVVRSCATKLCFRGFGEVTHDDDRIAKSVRRESSGERVYSGLGLADEIGA